ncbi:MAG: hypothetical protein ACT4PU_11635 [Planctomycetota bacterium]
MDELAMPRTAARPVLSRLFDPAPAERHLLPPNCALAAPDGGIVERTSSNQIQIGRTTLKVSRTRFVAVFLLCGFAFQFISNSVLGSEVRLFPARSESFLGLGSVVAWKSAVSALLLPIKVVLIGPLLPLTELPDLPPPILVLGFALYWTLLALLIHYFLGKAERSKRVA